MRSIPISKFSGFRIQVFRGSEVLGIPGENRLFQNVFHGGSRDALVHLLPMKPSAKEFQDSDRGEPPSGVRMDVPGNEFLQKFSNKFRRCKWTERFDSPRLRRGKLPGFRIQVFCGSEVLGIPGASRLLRNVFHGGAACQRVRGFGQTGAAEQVRQGSVRIRGGSRPVSFKRRVGVRVREFRRAGCQ